MFWPVLLQLVSILTLGVGQLMLDLDCSSLSDWTRTVNNNINKNTTCTQQIEKFNYGLANRQLWAQQVSKTGTGGAVGVSDAGGRYPGGLFSGNSLWLGSRALCDQLIEEKKVPFDLAFVVISYHVNVSAYDGEIKSKSVSVGQCVPASCDSSQLTLLLNGASGPGQAVRSVRRVKDNFNPWTNPAFNILVCICFCVVVLTFFGTACHVFMGITVDNPPLPPMETKPTQLDSTGSFLLEASLSFSVVTNVSKVCSLQVGDDTLSPIHGLRLLSMLWVILVHTCLIVFQVADNKSYRNQVEGNFLYKTLSSGAYSVDTFFVLSGCLVTFLYLRTRNRYSLRQLTTSDGNKGELILFATMVFYRYIRLTPPYAVVLTAVATDMAYFHESSLLRLPSADHMNCAASWWRNLLYVNTMFPLEEQCMNWSWYLADDTQFYIVAIIILILSARYAKACAYTLLAILLFSLFITILIALHHNHIPSIQDPFAHYNSLYDKPWARVGPYLVGIWTGWFLYTNDCVYMFNKIAQYVGWTLAGVCTLGLVYGVHFLTLGPVTGALYSAVSHSLWGLGIAWVIIACVTGYGGWVNSVLSWKYLYPLSRVTYCVYLIHPQIMKHAILSSDSPTHISTFIVAVIYFGFVSVSYMIAFVFSILFEAPFVALLRLIHPRKRPSEATNQQ